MLTVRGALVPPSSTVRDLGIVLDSEMSFGSHVSRLVSSCFYQLHCMKSCLRALPFEAAKTVVNSFVMSRIDYCNCLLAGAPKYLLERLQLMMNAAAKLICGG
jgi:hypothetical protein